MQGTSQIVTTNKPLPSFLQARCPSCRPTNSLRELKGKFYVMCIKRESTKVCWLHTFMMDVAFTELVQLIEFTRATFLQNVSKAKAAKLVRTLIDLFLDMEAGSGKEVRMSIVSLFGLRTSSRIFSFSSRCRCASQRDCMAFTTSHVNRGDIYEIT